jgi:uncharacterized membrane protein YgaE (UPF0421/DUF939 family)
MAGLLSLIDKENPLSLTHSTRTAAAAVVSMLIAGLLRLPESYWAGITTLAVIQSTPEAAQPAAVQYIGGTVVGALVGGWAGERFPGNPFVLGACAFAMGLVFSRLRLERSAYRTATVTLAILMLVPAHAGWTVAIHRFFDVLLGVTVGLIVSALWPER